MPNDYRVVAGQDFLDEEAHNPLAFDDIQCIGCAAQLAEECRECFREAQKGGAVLGLISDRLQVRAQCLFSLPQRRHSVAQLLE